MKILHTANGRFTEVSLAPLTHDAKQDCAVIEQNLMKFARRNGGIETLCVDFSGEYIPIQSRDELRIVAMMLRAYATKPEDPSLSYDQVRHNIRSC